MWMMSEALGHMDVGSCYPASECVKTKYTLSLGPYGEIFPEENQAKCRREKKGMT